MLHIQSTTPDARTLVWSSLQIQDQALTFAEVFARWRSDVSFVAEWVQRLRSIPFAAYCWECPPNMANTLGRPFECVFIDSPLLADSAENAGRFTDHFDASREAVSFPSLGRDAVLVAPCPRADGADRAHLAKFMRTADESLAIALWRTVGEVLESRVRDTPVWVSTAGLGVSWLHVRLDSHPKYYRHAPYRQVRHEPA